MITGKIALPGDKSISHRAALFSAIHNGTCHFENFNLNNDCSATLSCLNKMGVASIIDGTKLTISGKHPHFWTKPITDLDAQNSGTTARLISGLLAGCKFSSKLNGDESLAKRPMQRIITPLQQMGASIQSNNGFLPLTFKPATTFKGIEYVLPVASAQVKSAVLLAGLLAEGQTQVTEPDQTRDHTERMLGLNIQQTDQGKVIQSSQRDSIPDISMYIPGDFSSAAFYMCAALMMPGSELRITNSSLNPTRTGLLTILKEMGADAEVLIAKEKPEPIGDIIINSCKTKNIAIPKDLIPNIIDEIPILAILASQSEGMCLIRNARELRFKESDRIKTVVSNLRAIGIQATEFEDGFSIEGPQKIKGGQVTTYGDHRIAMAFTIASLLTDETINIDNPDCAAVSFPDFYKILKQIVR